MTDLHVNPSVIIVPDLEAYLAYDVDSGRLSQLNASAALVVELLEEGCNLDQMREALTPILGEAGWDESRSWIASSLRDGLFAEGAPSKSNIVVRDAQRLETLAWELRDRDCVLAAYACQLRSLELAPGEPQSWYRLGELAQMAGRRDVARDAYERYFQHHPDDAEVEHLLVSLGDEPPPARVPDRCIRQIYASFSSYYEEKMRGELEYRAPELLRDAVARIAGDRSRLSSLDLGCGSGLSGAWLRPMSARLEGVDLSPEMIERAAAAGAYDTLHEAEITAFLAGDSCGLFDLIVSCDALIYFGDLHPVLSLARQRLTPGGLVAFTVEQSDRPPFRLTDSGRFAHHRSHAVNAAQAAGLRVEMAHEAVLRREYGEPVTGIITVCSSRERQRYLV